MSVADILEKAADLIEPEGAWIKGAIAGDHNGRPLRAAVTGADFCAHCWCSIGALEKAAWLVSRDVEKRNDNGRIVSLHREVPAAAEWLATAAGLESFANVAEWNDAPERTQAEVVAKLREAAALARQEASDA